MTLIVVTIVAIASVTTALAIHLFMIGTVLGRTAVACHDHGTS
jgi:hypothetical protein